LRRPAPYGAEPEEVRLITDMALVTDGIARRHPLHQPSGRQRSIDRARSVLHGPAVLVIARMTARCRSLEFLVRRDKRASAGKLRGDLRDVLALESCAFEFVGRGLARAVPAGDRGGAIGAAAAYFVEFHLAHPRIR